ncbi:MAG: T9SS type A sorting domain-containing protein, partial [Flavobacteriales bacterium]
NVNLIFSQLHNNMVISLKNELGQVVMNEKSINKKSTVIDLKKIDKGIYFLVLSSDDGEEVVKIIKN